MFADYLRHREEISQRSREYDAVVARHPYKRGKYLLDEADVFGYLVVHCKEIKLPFGGAFSEQTYRIVDAVISFAV